MPRREGRTSSILASVLILWLVYFGEAERGADETVCLGGLLAR
jgi:hypothetical protein